MSEERDEGVRLVMTPVQLAAVLAGESLNESAILTNRLWGGLRLIGGTLELVGAGALCIAPEPTMASKAGCAIFGLHGFDTFSAGARQVWTGHDTVDLLQAGTAKLARALGADPTVADRIGLAVDIGVPFAMSAWLAATRIASIRGGRINLVEHEAQAGSRIGGHTLAKHVGQTEAQLQARLIAEPRIPTASTFASLRAAEDAISKVLKLEAATVKSWARAGGARPLRLQRDVGGVIGTGVVRGTGKLTGLTKVRVVLRYQTYNGKPYYILTAFPDL